MANPRKPAALKALAGTTRANRVVEEIELPILEQIPACPDWMPNAHAVKEWNRLVPILMGVKLLTQGTLGPLAHYCALHGKAIQLYAAGESPTASMLGTLRNMANDFGLTPVSQGKVKSAGGEPDKGNAFAGNGRRPAAK